MTIEDIKNIMEQNCSFKDSFSGLQATPHLPINQVTINNCKFTNINTDENSADFSADLQAAGPLQTIAWMVPGELKLTGTIQLETIDGKQFPIMTLQANVLETLSFGIFELKLVVRLRSGVHSIPNSDPSCLFWSQVELVTEFVTSKLTLPVVLPLYGEGQYLLSFYLDLTKQKPPISGLNDLSGFTDNNDPANLLNPEISLDNAAFSLDSLSAVLNPNTRQLVNLQIGVSFEIDWTIIPGVIELEKIGAVFTINNPASPKLENISTYLFAQLKVGPVYLETSILLPDRILEAHLAYGSEININDVINTFARGVSLPGNDPLSIYQLEVYARVKQGQETYSLEAAASGTLTIIEGLSLNNISFFISYENKALSDVRLGGTLTLTQSNVELFLQAEYQYDNGWQFIGSTGTDQQIPIGSLITDIVEKFEVDQTLPAPLTGLTIENLYVSFNTKSKDFTFSGRADFPINGTNFDIKINIAITHLQEGGFEKRFGGHLTIGTTIPLQFDLVFDKNPEKSLMLAGYHDAAGHNISLKDLLQSLMGDVKIPDVLTFSLNDALLVYDKESTATTSKQLFVAHIGSGIDLSNLPLIGKLFPPNQTINLAYQILVTSTDFSKEIIAAVNTLMPEGISTLANDKDISERLSLATSIQLGSETIQLDLPVVVNQDPTAENPDPVKSTADSVEPKWFNLKKTFGPVHFNRIGVTYKESKLKFLLDASLAAGGLTISLDGLSVSSPLTRFEPQFDLKGLGIDYTNDALEIGGAFLRQHIVDGNREYDEYDGLAIIKLEKFTIGAIGSYAYVDNHPSLFIYASINEPIGGPAFFFVTGLSAGFGYNRSLRIPSIDNVASFPLVADAMKGETPPTNAGKDFLAAKLAALRDYIPPTPGEMFLAVGVKFTSFKLIESFALLTLSFGNRFEIDLLGISTLIVPPQQAKTPLAEIQMAFKATYVPDEGFLGVNAQLTPHSYILSKDCRLTGGFAFYSWFSGEHKGDFVTTLGGYHPEFNVPSHYPVVPRLGFNWIVNDHFHIKGDAYFALCPHALMAGGHLEAVYESGSFKAWFKEGADFLVAWKPYHYDANIYADIGASLTYHFFGTHHITIQVGANVHIWGPEFGGDATVKIWILTFHITFGDQSSQQPGPIDWNTFRNSFLPGDTTKICSVVAAGGLVTQGSDSNDLGVVNPKELILRTDSVIPTKRASVPLEADKVNTNFGIGSMEISANDLKSTQTITIQRKENNTWKTLKTDFSYKPILKKVPAGLWGTQLNPPLNGARFIDNALTGFEITPAKSPCPGQTKPVNRDYFKYETHAVKNSFGWEERKPFNPSKPSDDDPRAKINRTIMETATSTKRSNLLQALGVDWPIDLNDRAADDFLFVPQIQEVAA